MNKRILIGVVIGVVVIGVVAWLLMGSKQDTAAPSNTTGNTSTNTSNTSISGTITYTDNGFSPATLSVKSGDTIRVVNQSSTSLQLSSDPHPTHSDNPELNMSALEPGKDSTLKVTRTGTWGYHNHENASDTGKITVN